jgi:hypothetical protein
VRLLLERQDTDVNLATYYGTTALTYAIRSQIGLMATYYGTTALTYAIRSQYM